MYFGLSCLQSMPKSKRVASLENGSMAASRSLLPLTVIFDLDALFSFPLATHHASFLSHCLSSNLRVHIVTQHSPELLHDTLLSTVDCNIIFLPHPSQHKTPNFHMLPLSDRPSLFVSQSKSLISSSLKTSALDRTLILDSPAHVADWASYYTKNVLAVTPTPLPARATEGLKQLLHAVRLYSMGPASGTHGSSGHGSSHGSSGSGGGDVRIWLKTQYPRGTVDAIHIPIHAGAFDAYVDGVRDAQERMVYDMRAKQRSDTIRVYKSLLKLPYIKEQEFRAAQQTKKTALVKERQQRLSKRKGSDKDLRKDEGIRVNDMFSGGAKVSHESVLTPNPWESSPASTGAPYSNPHLPAHLQIDASKTIDSRTSSRGVLAGSKTLLLQAKHHLRLPSIHAETSYR